MVHCRVHKGRQLVPIPSQINPDHITPSHLCYIHFNIILLYIPCGPYPSGVLTEALYAFLFYSMHAICPLLLILLGVTFCITL